MFDILTELNADTGSNYKMDVLRKHADNALLKRVLKMAYDKVAFTYGISMKNVEYDTHTNSITLDNALDILETQFANRTVTGLAAIAKLEDTFTNLSANDALVLKGIINRDLRINMGRSNINKVFKNLIVKPVYMRCGLFTEKTKNKINPIGAYVQLKADGTYREFTVSNGSVMCISRSGEIYDYPVLNQIFKQYPDGHYIGELTVYENGSVLGRSLGNGMINSNTPPHEKITIDLWDYVTLQEYNGVVNKTKGKTPYYKRFAQLQGIVASTCTFCNEANREYIAVIETHIVQSYREALEACTTWMNNGLEGAILKDANAIFRDGTSSQQLKLKLEIDIDVRWVGFKEGKIGTKREATFGSAMFESDDGQIKGFCSGFTDAQLIDINGRRNEMQDVIFTVTCNDITKGRGNEYYALSHPRFSEIRNDKTVTDTIERALEMKEMAMAIGT